MSTIESVVAPQPFSSLLISIVGLPARSIRAFLVWRRRREGIRLLLELDDRLLHDAGFIRAELKRLR